MRSRSHKYLAALALLPLAAGCVQATRHSNTMIFGTNTTFGVKAGASTGEVPEIIVGYDRQEAVIMPLLANNNEKNGSTNQLSPCDPTKPLTVVGADYIVHPCSFVASKGAAQDSYSVLASFGAEFSAKAQTSPEASGGLAQYFATGMAAQILAAKGGAALVSTSRSAGIAAASNTEIAALFPDGTGDPRPVIESIDDPIKNLRVKIAATSDNALAGKMKGFEAKLGGTVDLKLEESCTDVAQCIHAVDQKKALMRRLELKDAVDGWNEY